VFFPLSTSGGLWPFSGPSCPPRLFPILGFWPILFPFNKFPVYVFFGRPHLWFGDQVFYIQLPTKGFFSPRHPYLNPVVHFSSVGNRGHCFFVGKFPFAWDVEVVRFGLPILGVGLDAPDFLGLLDSPPPDRSSPFSCLIYPVLVCFFFPLTVVVWP